MVKKQFFLRYLQFFKKISALFLVIIVVSVTGCITYLTDIKVRGDGSGTMVQTITLNPEQMKQLMETVGKQMGATMTESKEASNENESVIKSTKEPFNESELKGKAMDMGQGVTFVSAEKIDTKQAAGIRVTYAFRDINQLSFSPKPEAALGSAAAGASSQEAVKFRFNHMPNGNASLTVVFAKVKEDKEQQVKTPPPAASDEQSELIRQMFKGLHMGISVTVEGKVIKTNSPYVEGSKVTLMDIDFDPLLSDEKTFKELSAKLEDTMGDDRKTMDALKGVKGLQIITEPEVFIEFAPK